MWPFMLSYGFACAYMLYFVFHALKLQKRINFKLDTFCFFVVVAVVQYFPSVCTFFAVNCEMKIFYFLFLYERYRRPYAATSP